MDCELKKIKLYYEIHGEGYPILMLHGFEVDHRVMKGCMEPIFEKRQGYRGYKRIYFDLPGMGNTKGENWIKNSDQFLEIVIEFIDKIIPNQKFIIASESYGCYLARGVIVKKFNFIEGILFICPVIYAESNTRKVPKHVILLKDSNLIERLSPYEATEFENTAVIQTERIWNRFNNEFFSGVKKADKRFLSIIWEKGYPFSFNVDKMIKQFDKPTLFLLGRQDSIVGYADAWELMENYPRASFIVLDQGGHLLQIEKEQIFNTLVNDWLDRVEMTFIV
jgi:pimeloyl-ACP methyl ester carboxylesterase